MASKIQNINVTQQKKVYVKSESAFEEMKANGQLEPLTDYFTPDETESGFMPVGMIFQSAIPIDDARVHALDGSSVMINGIYADFVNYLKEQKAKGYDLYYTNSGDYEADLSTYGQCGKFLLNEIYGLLRFPTVKYFTQGVGSLTDIGSALKAGLPNITGNLGANTFTSGEPFDNGTALSGNGRWSGPDGQGWVMTQLYFDASKSNSIYGNSNTVQPQAIRYPYYIVVASGYKSTQQVNFDNIASEINILKKRYLTHWYVSGTTWYNIYSDGWKECGGFVNNANAIKSITFPITFSNKPLQINATSFYSIIEQTLYQPHIDDITTTSFNVASYGERGSGTNGSGNPIYWEAKGY